MDFNCYHCHKRIGEISDTVGRSDCCPNCGFDVRVCLNCRHYDTSCYNDCREPSAERVVDKTKRNFCDHFSPRSAKAGQTNSEETEKSEQLKKLDELFK